MFSLHETTRKRICRTAFFALCLAPTCATAAWIADHHLPWRAASAARRLSDRYHFNVTLAGSSEPRPRMTRTAAVTLAAPGAAAPLLELAGVETHRRGDALILTVDQLSLAVADIPALAARLEWSLARTDAAKVELRAAAVKLRLANQDSAIGLFRLRAVVERTEAGQPRLRAAAHFSSEPSADEKPITLALEPVPALSSDASSADDSSSPAARRLSVTLDAQYHPFPIGLFAPLVPGAAGLNDAATFAGVVTWRLDPDAPSLATAAGAFHGRLAGVDLARILPPKSPHHLAGKASVELTACRWQGEQFNRLAGELHSPSVEANGSLLIAARAYLGCPIAAAHADLQAAAARAVKRETPAAEDAAVSAALHQLDHFACRFELSPTGFDLRPRIPAASTLPAGVLAASGDHPVLHCPPLPEGELLPAVAWLQFAASPPGGWIPFTPATLETARRFPAQK